MKIVHLADTPSKEPKPNVLEVERFGGFLLGFTKVSAPHVPDHDAFVLMLGGDYFAIPIVECMHDLRLFVESTAAIDAVRYANFAYVGEQKRIGEHTKFERTFKKIAWKFSGHYVTRTSLVPNSPFPFPEPPEEKTA